MSHLHTSLFHYCLPLVPAALCKISNITQRRARRLIGDFGRFEAASSGVFFIAPAPYYQFARTFPAKPMILRGYLATASGCTRRKKYGTPEGVPFSR
jgi:hypothetical protein